MLERLPDDFEDWLKEFQQSISKIATSDYKVLFRDRSRLHVTWEPALGK